MISLTRTDSAHPHFQQLVVQLDKDLQARYGAQQAFFNQFNKLNSIHHVVIAYADGDPVGCGAIKAYTTDIAEVKRMYVSPEFRGQGIALQVLTALEQWA